MSAAGKSASISERDENNIIFKSLQSLHSHRLTIATSRWVLSARIHSPHVHFHYELASHIHTQFARTDFTQTVFAVVTSAARDSSSLFLHPNQLDAAGVATARYPSPILDLSPGNHVPLFSSCPRASQLPTLVLYAHLPNPSFSAWMLALKERAPRCEYNLALRFAPPLYRYHAPRAHPALQAFVAHITLRSTEYKVVDDRVFDDKLFADCPPGLLEEDCNAHADDDDAFAWPRDAVVDSKDSFTPLKAALFVRHRAGANIESVIDAVALIAEDAPSVTRTEYFRDGQFIQKDDAKAIGKASRKFRESIGDRDALFINGFPIDLLGMRQGAGPLLQCLGTISAAADQFVSISRKEGTAPPSLPRASGATGSMLRVLLPTRTFLPNALVWFNDMLSDSRYKKWPALDLGDVESVDSFVSKVDEQRKKKGSDETKHLRLVKTRSHHMSLLLILDPADLDHLPYVTVPESIVRADLPIRVGVVLIPNGRNSELVAAAFYHFLRENGLKVAVQFLGMVRQVVDYFGGSTGGVSVSEQIVHMAFQQITQGSDSEYSSAAEVLQNDKKVAETLKEARLFAEQMKLITDVEADDARSGSADDAAKRASMLCIFNGIIIKDLAGDVITLAIKEQERVGSLLAGGALKGEDIANLSLESWVESDENLIVVNKLSGDMRKGEGGQKGGVQKKKEVPSMSAKEVVDVWENVNIVEYENGMLEDSSMYKVTVWFACDIDDSDGCIRMKGFVKTVASSDFAKRTATRISVIPHGSRLHEAILQSVSERGGDHGILVLNGRRLLAAKIESIDDLVVEIASTFESATVPDTVYGGVRLLHQLYKSEIESACSQGRRDGEWDLAEADVLEAAKSNNMSSLWLPEGSVDSHDLDDNSIPLSSIAVIDPVSPNAFVTVSILRALRAAFGDDLAMSVIVAPIEDKAATRIEPPKTFYKFLLEPNDWADEDAGGARFPTRLSFDRLPQENVLTVAVEPPRALFVSSYATNYDMDNVILNNVYNNVDLFTEYELKNLIVEGSCVDEAERPPQGLKLILANENGVMVDTLVMANLGYFQLKVPVPGLWWLSLARGASSLIFSLRAMEMYNDGERTVFEADTNGRVPIPVESLSGAGGILLRVVRRPGMEGKSVLDPTGEEKKGKKRKEYEAGDMMGKLKSKLRNLYSRKSHVDEEAQDAASEKDETIHVFSVASGHLYERFLKIMISSVTNHASHKVKFWLLENYLSPSFKKLLPEFAKHHGAEVGMVTYRWPGWLRAQTEKQRIIWAYKILFLDVLFPLDVGRIIFVDADQVIRGDLAELMNMDLKGAPYGYVPFCDSRKEVEGYRFWKTGFWKETLRGAKYRISALYVVDLHRFRETAAGDSLRYIYQSLSADPNSLSNLDQDLPNYASVGSATGSSVPIFDLPQEWLWCETWCDDESKTEAKAIDLCNNPDTKEPKLESAKRIISEWVDLDDRASKLTEVIYKGLLGSGEIDGPGRGEGQIKDNVDREGMKTEL